MQIATLTNEQMPASKLLDRATVEQWAAEAREDLPNQLGTDFDELEVMLAVARRAAEQPAPQAVQAAYPHLPHSVAADRAKRAATSPEIVKLDRGFRWDSEKQHHVPTLLIEFTPVPANSPYTEKGWADRDALAAALAATAHPAEVVQAQSVAVADARSARQITDAIVENFKDAGWYVPSVDEALVLEAVSAAIVEHGASEPLTGVASDVDSMARVLMAAFAKAEPEHPITRYPTSFVATFADMARAAIAAAQLAEGVPAQSYVVDFFKAKGFYPSPAQAFAAGVAFAATQPAAQGMDALTQAAGV